MIYSPAEDSFLLAKAVSKFSNGKDVLDMCSGSGIQARTALENGAKSVLAAEIDKESLSYLKSQKIPCVGSDLFSRVKGKFDVIICNPPYLPLDSREDKESSLATTGGKNGDEITLKFLRQSRSHLRKGGLILILLSSLTPLVRIDSALKKLGMKKRLVCEENLFMEKIRVFVIKKSQ